MGERESERERKSVCVTLIDRERQRYRQIKKGKRRREMNIWRRKIYR